MKQRGRVFVDARDDVRCRYNITLKDKTKAQCGRRIRVGAYCLQHAKIVSARAREAMKDRN